MAKVVTDGDIGSGLEIVAGKLNRSAITKADVDLGNVDNTSDINKPVSTAQQTAINAVVEDAIVDGVTTKAPSQNAVFEALSLKADLASPALTGTPTAPTATAGTNTNQLATTAFVNNSIVNETTGVFSNLQSLINNNPSGTTINLKPNAIYIQDNGLIVKDRITINGNGATLKRNTQVTTTLSIVANQTSTSITVASIPTGLVIGDKIQLYTDTTVNTSSQSVEITNIVGNVLTLKNALVHSNLPTYTWSIGAIVRKVYNQINTPLDGTGLSIPTVYTIRNLVLDGDLSNNGGNFYWGVNSGVFNNGKSLFENCKFVNMPNENIIGHGFSIKNCYAENLNGSFIHQSANITFGEDVLGGEISGNTTKNTNIKATPSVTGHSEGVICFSFSSGRISIHGNRFLGGGEAVLGIIASSVNAIDGANKNLIFNDNYAENFQKVVSSFNYFSSGFVTNVDNISISNNIFSNCGVQDWSVYASNIANMGVVKFTGNLLTNGTVVSNIPNKMTEGFLLSGGTVNKIPKYNSFGQLTDGSLTDKTTIVETNKPIFKSFPTQGTTATPVFDKVLVGGIESTNESGIELGNSFGNNNGTFLRIKVNSSATASTPIYPMTFNSDGSVTAVSTIEASPATASNQVVVKSQLDAAARPYKVYTALISQTGTNAPVATVLENTLGGTVVWSRTSTGVYRADLSGAFIVNKTVFFTSNNNSTSLTPLYFIMNRLSDNSSSLSSSSGTTFTDSLLESLTIEIRVYP